MANNAESPVSSCNLNTSTPYMF